MPTEFNITYSTQNEYDSLVNGAFWQFLIIPEENDTQQVIDWKLESNLPLNQNESVNGLGFKSIHAQTESKFTEADFKASFRVQKKSINPFDFIPNQNWQIDMAEMLTLSFRTTHDIFLRKTKFTNLPTDFTTIFPFDTKKNVFDNLMALNHWVFIHLFFKVGVTHVDTPLKEIIEKRHGVCQDFTHLFLAIARINHIPARYVSGYLHQGHGYFGDSQMHAWAEAYVPKAGWVGFDPTNDILVGDDHIKICHGLDYSDCSPLKGVVYSSGSNKTSHSIEVRASQQ
ncbi:transglutaminase-like domain-containing protein [Flagellimonas sp.]|uniref:transglutaminase-like domain-containing protein n=1 Tax=Flagellimonas sp. TaxID=2058762 RepID=UPI003F49CF00